MAYNTTDQVYYLKQYSEIKDEFTEEQLVSFLEDVLEGGAKVWCILEGVNDHDSDDREARGLLPIIAYRGKPSPERATFFRLQVFYLFIFIYLHLPHKINTTERKWKKKKIYIYIYMYIYIYHY